MYDSKVGSPQKSRSLRNLWINPGYQGRYIFWVTFTGLVLAALYSVTFYLFVRENYKFLVDLSPMTNEVKTLLHNELRKIMIYMIFGSTIFLLITSIIGLFFSHRAAGAIYHFKRVFGQISLGDKSARVKLRPNDEFQDAARAFNEMMDKLAGEGSAKKVK